MQDKDLLLFDLAQLLLGRILQDIGVEAVAHVDVRDCSTGFAEEEDIVPFDLDDSLRVAAVVALHVLLDESLQKLH